MTPALSRPGLIQRGAVMTTGIAVINALRSRVLGASAFGFFLALLAAGPAAAQGTPEQRRACTPDVYRLCAGEIPNARAITACLRRQKGSLSPACAAVFEQ